MHTCLQENMSQATMPGIKNKLSFLFYTEISVYIFVAIPALSLYNERYERLKKYVSHLRR